MPRFDFQCPACKRIRPDVWVSLARIEQRTIDIAPCECGATMERLPAAPSFVVTGFNAKNGYAK